MKEVVFMKKICIVEDEDNIAQQLSILLEQNGYETCILTSFDDVVCDILASQCDFVLLDIKLPKINGQMILKELRQVSNVCCIMVTSQNTDMDEMLSLSYGADDYITKPYHPTLLLLRIEAIFRRLSGKQKETMYRDVHIYVDKSTLEKNGQAVLLSKNEMGIFNYLFEHKGTIVSRDDLMDYLWDQDAFVDDNTLTVNVTRLRKKLEALGLVGVIETRRGQGYILL